MSQLINHTICRDQVDFQKLINEKAVKTTLLDHHILNKEDEVLQSTVVQIFDHRPMDSAMKWNEDLVKIRIEQVGSCSTLITDEILQTNAQTLFRELAYMIYGNFTFH